MLRVGLRLLSVAFMQWPDSNSTRFPALPDANSSSGAETTRQRIFAYISLHPGTHLRQVCRELGLAMGDVQYHIHRLERDGQIASTRRGFYRFFYPSTLFGERQKDVLSVLALDTPRELLLTIVEKPGTSQEELARAAGVSQPTASWHLKRLTDLRIVQREQRGRSTIYSLAGSSPIEIATFLKNYHPSSWERWSSRLADIFISYSVKEDAGDKK